MTDVKEKRERSQFALATMHNLIDSRRLFYFYNVAKSGSLTGAGMNVDIAQPALTRQIKQLEFELGVTLFHRDGRGVKLTDAGRKLYARAETILGVMAESAEEVRFSALNPTRHVRIASPPMFASRFMAPAIERFVARHPSVHVTATEVSTGRVYDLLTSGDVDIGIVMLPAKTNKLSIRKILADHLVVVAHPGHEIGHLKFVTPEKLAQLDLILPPQPNGSRSVMNTYMEAAGRKLAPLIQTDSLGAIKALVAGSQRCGILPEAACQEDVAAGRLIVRPMKPALWRNCFVATATGRSRPPEIAAFVKDILHVVKSGPDSE